MGGFVKIKQLYTYMYSHSVQERSAQQARDTHASAFIIVSLM